MNVSGFSFPEEFEIDAAEDDVVKVSVFGDDEL